MLGKGPGRPWESFSGQWPFRLNPEGTKFDKSAGAGKDVSGW